MTYIWQRYFLRELMKVFCLFIGSFYFVYVLIDYSVHTKDFQSDQITFQSLLIYYGCQFTKRADILIPVALLIATIKVLTTSTLRHEIVALAAGGISLKTILRPFIWAALAFSALLYLNFQWAQPFCLNQITTFEERIFKGDSKGKENLPVHSLVLQDGSLLIYQSYNPAKKTFFDTYWLRDTDHIFRIQSLMHHEKVPYGTYVDTINRLPSGELMKVASYARCSFPQIQFDQKTLYSAAHPPRMQSISELAHTMGWKQVGFKKMNDREAEAATFFYFKLLVPLVCLLAVLGPAPFCLRFSRTLPVYMIYALSLFGMIAFYTLLNACLILGQSQVIAPLAAILLPQTALFVVLVRYARV